LKRGNELISTIILPEFYRDKDAQEVVKQVMSSVNIKNYDITTNEGLEKYLDAVHKKVEELSIINNPNGVPQNVAVGRCLTIWAVVALVVWDAIAVVNYGLLVNVGAAVNVAVAVNAVNATNTKTVYGEERRESDTNSKYEYEKRIQEIFNISIN
jgi:hypothetical protein